MPRKTSSSGSITIQHVAEHAGVSMQAVAAVVNGSRSGTRVSEKTRERILATAAALGYRPNAIARSLRHQRTGIIGYYSGHPLIYPNTPFQAEILTGLQQGCENHRKDLLVHGKYQGRLSDAIYRELANGMIDGLVLFSPPNHELTRSLAESHLPVVAITDATPLLPSVVVDDITGGRLQAEHLAARGYRSVLYRTAGERYLVSAVRRQAAFQEAAGSLGLTVVESAGDSPYDLRLTELERDYLRQSEKPVAIVAWQDGAAVNLLRDALGLGFSVPREVGVVGFDGIPVNSSMPILSAWQVTTIAAPWQEVAATSVAILKEQIEEREVQYETVLPVALLPGNTT